MSRVHDALRRAEKGVPEENSEVLIGEPSADIRRDDGSPRRPEFLPVSSVAQVASPPVRLNIHPAALAEVAVVPFQPAPESHLLDLNNSHETPAEEFRTLRTRLNHLQTLQPLHTIIVT